MAAQIYLISEAVIRNESLIDKNLDSMFLSSAIKYAQGIDLQEILGSALYGSVLSQAESGVWKSQYYRTLLDDYIQPYLVQQVMAEITVPVFARFKNQGVVTGSDSHFQNLSMSDALRIKEEYGHKAVFLANRMREYIMRNRDSFDELTDDARWLRPDKGGVTGCPVFFPKNI